MPRHSSPPRKPRLAGTSAAVSSAQESREGEPILRSGIYQVFHAGHRAAHNVVLVSGERFPRCARCGSDVRFRLVQATSDIRNDADFRVQLYEIPHPASPEADENEVA